MQLLLSSSTNPEEFKWWYITETVLILINYVICIVATVMAPKLRFHVHFKVNFASNRRYFLQIAALFIFSQYFIFLTARLIVLGYQSQILQYTGLPEDNTLIVACAWFRIYFIVMLQTMNIPLVTERELCLYFIQDYATKRRTWIPVLFIAMFISISASCASAAVFEWVDIFYGFWFLDCIPCSFFLILLSNYRRTWILNNALKNRKPSRVKYTLAVRYQLEENLTFAESIVFPAFVIIIVHAATFIMFILSQLSVFHPETIDLFLRLFHLLVAADGPIITIGLFIHNTYLKKVLKEMFCGAPIEPERDEGDSYFEQLEIQWEEPTEKKRRWNRQKTLLMRFLFLDDE